MYGSNTRFEDVQWCATAQQYVALDKNFSAIKSDDFMQEGRWQDPHSLQMKIR